ncbi:MAG: type II toxin-antitoxin system death-on-curing family toxin [Pseudomonadota bacterium]
MLEAHEQSLELFGGLPGISNLDSVLGALGRPYHGYHRAIWKKGAALLHGLATSHGFNDGNKRTAWLATNILYEQSGYTLATYEDDRIDDLMVDVVTGVVPMDELERWLKARTETAMT